MREENYPNWKREIIKKYLHYFSCKLNSDKVFDRFIYYAEIYKRKYGHVDIQINDVIDDYKIGMVFHTIKRNKDTLSEEKKKRLKKLDINLESKCITIFKEKMELAKQAVNDEVIISKANKIYNGVNLYNWIMTTLKTKFKNGELANDETSIVEKLLDKKLDELFKDKSKSVKIIDILKNKEIGIYKSTHKAAEFLCKEFNLRTSSSSILCRIKGEVPTPYKGRFMFYYATDEEVEKYLKENKVS